MWWRFPYNPTAYDDDWEDQPSQGAVYQWGLGVVLPLLLLTWGILALVRKELYWPGEWYDMTLYGANAVAAGMAAIAAALFVHCHYFWGNVYNQAWFAVLGKIAAVAGFIVSVGIVTVRVGVFGRN